MNQNLIQHMNQQDLIHLNQQKKYEQKIYPFKLYENYKNKEIFREYFTYQMPLFLIKALHKANKVKNEKKNKSGS